MDYTIKKKLTEATYISKKNMNTSSGRSTLSKVAAELIMKNTSGHGHQVSPQLSTDLYLTLLRYAILASVKLHILIQKLYLFPSY